MTPNDVPPPRDDDYPEGWIEEFGPLIPASVVLADMQTLIDKWNREDADLEKTDIAD